MGAQREGNSISHSHTNQSHHPSLIYYYALAPSPPLPLRTIKPVCWRSCFRWQIPERYHKCILLHVIYQSMCSWTCDWSVIIVACEVELRANSHTSFGNGMFGSICSYLLYEHCTSEYRNLMQILRSLLTFTKLIMHTQIEIQLQTHLTNIAPITVS